MFATQSDSHAPVSCVCAFVLVVFLCVPIRVFVFVRVLTCASCAYSSACEFLRGGGGGRVFPSDPGMTGTAAGEGEELNRSTSRSHSSEREGAGSA